MEEEIDELIKSRDYLIDTQYAIEPWLVTYKTFSTISWVLLVFTSWKAFVEKKSTYFLLEILNNTIFGEENFDYDNDNIYVLPLFIKLKLFHTFVMVLIIFGFINYIIYTMFRPNNKIDEGIFGKISKFNFIPLLLVSIIFSLMDSVYPLTKDSKLVNNITYYEYNNREIVMNMIIVILLLIFSILAFVSLILVYIYTDLSSNYIALISIKKGTYSSLLMLLWHNIFNCIFAIRFFNLLKTTSNKEQVAFIEDFFTTVRTYCPPVFGIGVIVFAFLFKDVIALFNNVLMNIGMLINLLQFFEPENKNNKVSIVEVAIHSLIILISIGGFFVFICSRFDSKLIK